MLVSSLPGNPFTQFALTEMIFGYACENCLKAIPILWRLQPPGQLESEVPEGILRDIPDFDYAHVDARVKADIEEALNCFSVNAFNGFAAMCRRTIQTICDVLGADSSTRVEAQIKELKAIAGLDDEAHEAVRQIMLTGHDGSHPQLPSVDGTSAELLLELLMDIVFQLFTRPGNIKAAAEKRGEAIRAQKSIKQ